MIPLMDILIVALATIGVFFMLVSAIGILRLPDVYTRMHAAGKAATLGISCILLSAGLFYGGWSLLRMIGLIVLFLGTAPIATTTMARAAYRTNAERGRTVLRYDELKTASGESTTPDVVLEQPHRMEVD